jgi:hypothetical protein
VQSCLAIDVFVVICICQCLYHELYFRGLSMALPTLSRLHTPISQVHFFLMIPNINSIANRDIIQRLNFMYQAIVYLQSLSTSASTSSTSSADSMDQSGVSPGKASGSITEPSSPRKAAKGRRRRVIGRKKTVNDLARIYVHALKVVGQKTTVKM